MFISVISINGTLALLFWLLVIQHPKERHLIIIAALCTCSFGNPWLDLTNSDPSIFGDYRKVIRYIFNFCVYGAGVGGVLLFAEIFKTRIPTWLKIYTVLVIALSPFKTQLDITPLLGLLTLLFGAYFILAGNRPIQGAKRVIVIGAIISFLNAIASELAFILLSDADFLKAALYISSRIIFPIFLLIYVATWLQEVTVNITEQAHRVVQLNEEKRQLVESQNILLEQEVTERTRDLNRSLENLKSTQSQLIQSEKMASLGELTAGIAHEIQNPLNFVNNFSEVNTELIEELEQEVSRGNLAEVKLLTKDIKENEQKINHHGKRAGEIVKGMLQHSRTSSGQKEPTDINALCDEYLRLSYHGYRAKDKSFNAKFETDFDSTLPKLNVVPQDIGRVVLNLINNAFYTVNEKLKLQASGYEPQVVVSTKNSGDKILISVKDNGNGIPDAIKEKIFQPFFTTKPTGQGTGLGLSLSYDIVKAHGGTIDVDSTVGSGTIFCILLPIQ